MKDISKLLKIILLFIFCIKSKESCLDDEINLGPLGNRCIKIDALLENEAISIELQDLQYLANLGKIEKKNYTLEIFNLDDAKIQSKNIKKSKIYIPNLCMAEMENKENIKLNKSHGIVIIAKNSNKLNINNIPEIFFVIRHNSQNSNTKYINSKYFDFSFCNKDPILLDEQISIDDLKKSDNTPIDIDRIMYAKKLKIDLFDPHSEFLNNICFKFTSEKNTDVTLDSRLEDYYQNIMLCNEKLSSHYIGFNYSISDKILTYRCAYGFYQNELEKESYIDNINNQMNFLLKSSNFKVITCYRQLLDLKNVIYNYGGIICVLVFFIQIILYINFCCKGTKPLEEKIELLFASAHEPIKNEPEPMPTNNITTNNEGNTEERLPRHSNDATINNVGIINKVENSENQKQNLNFNEEEEKPNINIVRKKKKKKSKKKIVANPSKKRHKAKIKASNTKKTKSELIIKDVDEEEDEDEDENKVENKDEEEEDEEKTEKEDKEEEEDENEDDVKTEK